MKKKVLAMLLALCMVLSMLPVSVFAAQPQPVTKTAPMKLDELPREVPAISTQAKYTVSLSGGSHGTTELLVSSPAASGSEVYFLADPDDGYLAEVYVGGIDPEELYYIGADTWGFYMPSNKVTIEVKYVAAEGEEHRVNVYDGGVSAGDWALSRQDAKAGESVLLGVYPNIKSVFDPLKLVWAFGADMYYLFEQGGIFYYEIFMGDEDVKILLTYDTVFSFDVKYQTFISNGDVTANVKNASTGREVFLYATPDPGYRVGEVRVKTENGGVYLELNYVGEENGTKVYSFIMPPSDVKVEADFLADTKTVTVRHNSGGTASANVSKAKRGDTVTVTCEPDDNYRVYRITGADGIKDNGNNTYSFSMPNRDVTIDVTFRTIYNPVTVTVETGLGGTAAVDVETAKAGDTITLTCAPEEGYRVARITGVDDLLDNGDDTYSFIMPAEPVDLKVLFLRNENPFLDINETQFFYDSVLWAYENGITGGVDATHFGPAGVCNRAQVVTFLWSAAGKPAPTLTENPFVDIPEKSWYTDAVLWAFEKGITAGSDDTHFNPAGICNRAQVVTFLYKAHGSAEPTLTENPFTDVPDGSWYAAPVLWAFENGITGGTDATHFNPGGQCLRAFAVTFLHKADKIPTVYPVNAQFDAEMGTVTLSHTEAQPGEVITATVIPAEGYELVNVHCVNDTGIAVLSDTEFTFVMPEHEEVFVAVFAPISEPDPVKTYELDVRDDGHGTIRYVDDKRTAAPGESIFFYAIPDPGYALTGVGVFNPYNEIDVSRIQLYSHENDLYELVMIDHDIILNCHFTPVG